MEEGNSSGSRKQRLTVQGDLLSIDRSVYERDGKRQKGKDVKRKNRTFLKIK